MSAKASDKMPAAEFAAARQRLGLTIDQLAAEQHMTPHVVEAWERGTLAVPRKVAFALRWRVVMEEQRALLDASELPTCSVLAALHRDLPAHDDGRFSQALQALAAHATACPTCQAREDYVRLHGPAMPELPSSNGRAMTFLLALPERLPAALRPPAGAAGDGRRYGVFFGAAFSAIAIAIVTLAAITQLTRGHVQPGFWRGLPGMLGGVIGAYFIGFYLAGTAYDALRPIGHRFIGYVLRWALAGACVYGTIGVVMPLFDEQSSWDNSLVFTLIMGSVWAVIGAVLWIKDRISGKLPKRAT